MMTMHNINQEEAVIIYLLKHPTITTREAMLDLGIASLSKRISNLRSLGLEIDKDWRTVPIKYGYGSTQIREYSLGNREQAKEFLEKGLL